MVKTVGGVVRHAGPLSPDTLPSNAFIITVEEKNIHLTLPLKISLLQSHCMPDLQYQGLSGNVKKECIKNYAGQAVVLTLQPTALTNSGQLLLTNRQSLPYRSSQRGQPHVS